MRNFTGIAVPLFQLTHKDATFQWDDREQSAFDQLKHALTSAPVVAFPRFSAGSGRFRLDTDASDVGIGVVLFQEQDGEDRVIAFASHRLSKSQRNYSTTRKELLACHFCKGFSPLSARQAFRAENRPRQPALVT